MTLRMHGYTRLALLLTASLAFAGCSKTPETSTSTSTDTANNPAGKSSGGIFSREKSVTVPAGTAIRVVLNQSISSKTARSGDPFDATVIEPVVAEGTTVIPKDAPARGHVVEARESGRLQTPARLSLTLDSVEVGGNTHNLRTSSVSRSGHSHKKRNIEIIGGGSALGAIVGAIAGHGKGAAIGAAAGAGAGTAAAAATGKKDIALPAEATLTFSLSEPLTIKVKE